MPISSTDLGNSLAEDFGGDWLVAFNVDFVIIISGYC